MTPERWQIVEGLFSAAKELNPADVDSYLRAQCGGDSALEQEVASLLRHDRLTVASPDERRNPLEGLLPTELVSERTDRLPVPLLSEGMKVGPYRVLHKLGEGGMGIVYQAHDERLDRVVALKTLRGAAIDQTAERRMWREARVAASLNHPGICRLFDVGDCHGRIYLVMELLEGEPLSRAISRESMALPQAIETMLGVLDALEALHEKALVHRDLKPSNIFLTPHGVKLLDFGLSRTAAVSAGGEEGDTQLAPMAGTPFYVSPEQMEGNEPDARSDLFAAVHHFRSRYWQQAQRPHFAFGEYRLPSIRRTAALRKPRLRSKDSRGRPSERLFARLLRGNPSSVIRARGRWRKIFVPSARVSVPRNFRRHRSSG